MSRRMQHFKEIFCTNLGLYNRFVYFGVHDRKDLNHLHLFLAALFASDCDLSTGSQPGGLHEHSPPAGFPGDRVHTDTGLSHDR